MEGTYPGFPGNGGLMQAAQQGGNAVERPQTMYEAHQAAVTEYHEACHDLQRAAARREMAAKRLHEITEKLAGQMQNALNDPTLEKVPMPTQASYLGR